MTATEAACGATNAAPWTLGGRHSVAAIGEKGRRQHALGLAPQLGQVVERTVGHTDDSRNDPQSLQK
jgi:hypothetical protein